MPRKTRYRSIHILAVLILLFSFAPFASGQDEAPAQEPEVTEQVENTVVEEPTEEPTEEPVVEQPTEEPVVEQPTEEPVVEESTEEPVVEQPTEEPVVEQPTEEPVVEQPTEEPVVEQPTEEPVVEESTEEPVVEQPTEEPVIETPEPVNLPAEPALIALFADSFDAELFTWTLGNGWAQVPNENGQALQVSNSTDPLTFTHNNIYDVAVQARFLLGGGSASLSVRDSAVGNYSATLDSNGNVSLLRAGNVLSQATLSLDVAQWQSLRLSAIGDVIRVAVNGTEVLGVQDAGALPPGTITISNPTEGTSLVVEDFQLWIPDLVETQTVVEPTPLVTEAPAVEAMMAPNGRGRGPGHGNPHDDGPLNFRPFNGRVKVKVLTIAMLEIGEIAGDFAGEAQHWVEGERMERVVNIPGGFSPAYCNRDGHCLMITGVGFSNAASSIMAAGLHNKLDLRDAYILIAGIAGVDPEDGTLGSAAWADWVVDGNLAHHIDAREMPGNFSYPIFRLNCYSDPFCPDGRTWGTEVYQLNTTLVDWAYTLTQGMTLEDNAASQAYRANYPAHLPAAQPPSVLRCDSLGASTYWHGDMLSNWANWWVSNWTGGAGNYCMTNQEDAATLTALKRLEQAGKVDFSRVFILRTASNFDQQYAGQTAITSLGTSSGGFVPSILNAYLVGSVVTDHIIDNWHQWRHGVPALP